MITAHDILQARILIVDDLAPNVAVLEQMLRGAGYAAVTSTQDPQDVCGLHRQHRYELILLDLQMPGMDGFQVLEGLKQIDPGADLPVLVITAQPGHKLRALKAGAKDFVSKPFDLGEVLIRVHNLLEIRLLHRHQLLLDGVRLDNSQRLGGIGDWEYDMANHRLLWSEEIYQILGIARKDFPPDSATFYRQVHPDDLARVHREKKVAAEGKRRVEFEHRIIRPNGEVRHIHQITGMMLDVHGQPTQESGTLQDITERKIAEGALRQSEERYRLMFEQNPSPMWVFDQETFAFLAVNAATLSLYGYTREEFLQLSALDIRPPETIPDFKRHAAIAPTALRAAGRFQHRKKDGTIFPVDILVHAIDFGGRPGRLVLALDMTEAERGATALRASESRFRALSESAPLGIFELDATGGCVYHNPILASLSGRSLEQNLGPGWKLSVHPEDRAIMSAGWTRAVATGTIWDQEQRLLRPDGTVRWVHTLAAPVRDAEGRTTGFVGTVEDITSRRLSEESLERGQMLLRIAGRLTRMGAWSVDLPNYNVTWSDEVCAIHEVPAGFSPGIENALNYYAPEFRETITQAVRHCLQDGTSFDEELQIITAKGRRLWVRAIGEASRNAAGETARIQGAFQDISVRKLADVTLRDSEERFKFVARAVSDAVWDWNIVGNTVWWNEGYFTAFGYLPSDIQPSFESWSTRIHPDDCAATVDSIQGAIAGSAESWSAEYRFQRKDKTYASVQDRGFILRDPAGKAIRMVGGLRDLTEQKKMETQYLRAQRMDSIGTLAGGIAHDLNNVLAPILMSIELLKTDAGSDPIRNKMLDTIFVSCRRGADLVRQVMSFARGADGERVAIRLRHLVNDLEGMIGETFPRNIRIVSEVPNEIWPVTGDPTQLHQVLLNLAVNARDAMPHGGTLTIAASNVTLDAQYAGTSHEAKPGPHVLIKVTDTGMGIPPAVRDRIFEPFFTTKEVGKGTGIGLATVHAIVKSHGGFVTVDSEVGHGTTFVIHLPADPSLRSNVTQSPFAPVDLPKGNGELVLVVDDESSIREITQQTLEAFGYRVIAAADGAEAVALYAMQSQEIAAVLTDMMMPVMDGPATINVIRRINPAAKIIAASGIDSKDTLNRIGTAGVEHFLAKPYTAETLLLRMREAIDTQAAPVRVPTSHPLPRS